MTLVMVCIAVLWAVAIGANVWMLAGAPLPRRRRRPGRHRTGARLIVSPDWMPAPARREVSSDAA